MWLAVHLCKHIALLKECPGLYRAGSINIPLERQESWIISDWVKVPFEKV